MKFTPLIKTIKDAVDLMYKNKVSGLFVIDDNNKLVSLFTERDIIQSINKQIPLYETIEKVMDTNITTFSPSMAINAAIAIASRKYKRHLPVVEGDTIMGMITFRDLISYLLPEISYMVESQELMLICLNDTMKKTMKRLNSVKELISLREYIQKDGVLEPGKKRIRVCCGTGCRANNSLKLLEELKNAANQGVTDVEIISTGCQGLCQKGPVMIVEPQEYFYQRVQPQRARDIIKRTIEGEKAIADLFYRQTYGERVYHINEVPFYSKQKRVALSNNGRIDPTNIYQYIAVGG